jgi:mono/diheme cytochrome c family protein
MRILKWLGIAVGAVLACALVFACWATFRTWRVSHRTWPVTVRTVPIPTDSASLARGEHLVKAVGKCTDCHGADLSGGPVLSDAMFARLNAPNLTRGQGGAGARFTSDVEWVSAIRHGINGRREALAIMPAEAFQYMSDSDLGAVISYVKSVPAVDRTWPTRRFGPIATVLIALNKLPLFPAATVNHTREGMTFPAQDTTAAYGHYLADIGGCTACHNQAMSGGGPGGPPGSPPPRNLTMGGIPQWTEADFVRALREGRTPDGRELNNDFMPWRSSGLMTDAEIHAVWLRLRSLPAKQLGEQ